MTDATINTDAMRRFHKILEYSMRDTSICIVNNIPSPYRRALFDEVFHRAELENIRFSVLYLAESEYVRNWTVNIRKFETVLPVMWQKRNPRTPTSDVIINAGYVARALLPGHVILFGYNYLTYFVVALLRAVFRRPTHLFCETTLSDTGKSPSKRMLKSLLFRYFFDRFFVPGIRSAEYRKRQRNPL